MNDDALADQLAAAILGPLHAEHRAMGTEGGALLSRLGEVFKKLRALNIPWSKILTLIGPIIALLMSGGTIGWPAVWAAILALFTPTPPAPVPA